MTVAFSIKVFFEVLAIALLLIGFKHEEEVKEFETVLLWYIKKKIKESKKRVSGIEFKRSI